MAQAREDARSKTSKRPRPEVTLPDRSLKGRGRFVVVHTGEDVAEIRVSKTRFERIIAGKGALGKLIADYADAASEAKRTGRTFRINIEVTPDGRAEAVSKAPLEKGPVEQTASEPLHAAMARAKARGVTKVADILKGADMLTARDFGLLIGASHETVNAKRKRDEVLGLEGATRGVKYPRWQVTESGLPLPGLPRLFEVLGKQPWTVFRFLLSEHAELGGRTALDGLKSGQVDAVVEAAENPARGVFS